MLNIQNTRQITPSGQPAFTAYGDDVDPNAWYIPPKVIWAQNPTTNLPQFSLVKYNKSGGGVSGFCRFAVQLMIDGAQEDALKTQVPGATTPQFDWVSSAATLTYTIAGKSTSIRAQPSNFGSQTVTFSVPLPDAASIAAFENAFSGGSGAGTFGIAYELAADTRLPAVTVVSTFNSAIAYDYQTHNRYRIDTEYHTDTWGNTSSNQVVVYLGSYVTEMLNQSQAGYVTVTPGQGLTPTLLQMVQDWARVQLQKDVEQAVSTALALTRNPAPDFSMSSVASFTNTLKTTNVVPWYFNVEGTLPPFEAAKWKQLTSEVNQQQLQVTFQLQAGLASHGVERINATLKYGAAPEQTHTFAVGSEGPWFVTMNGQFDGSTFKPGYQYKYDVIYAKPGDGLAPPPLSTAWIDGESPTVNLGLVELGLLAVTFEAANVDWQQEGDEDSGSVATVKEISVEWNWVPGGGGPVLTDTIVLNSAQTSDTRTLRSAGPTNNQQYQYSLTFLMSDGTQLHATNLIGNTPRQRISHPLSDVTFGVYPEYPADTKAVILRATFDDEKNDIHLSKSWQVRAKAGTGGTLTLDMALFTDWTFKAVVANLNMATVVFSGTWIDGAGKQNKIPQTLLVGTNNVLTISDTQRTVTAVIDASNVDFVMPRTDGVYSVDAQLSYTIGDDAAAVQPKPRANPKTVTFTRGSPPVQYYSTLSVDITNTPTFWFQYIYTVNKDKGDITEVSNAWAAPQSTVSTSLPVMPGKPPAKPAATATAPVMVKAAAFEAHAIPRDARTMALLERHRAYCNSVETDVSALLAS